jgi:hypothetical protein
MEAKDRRGWRGAFMSNPDPISVLLFSYGTLQDKAVQMANFGRLLLGRADSLPGYTLSPITIEDASVVALSGKSQHMIAMRSEKAGDEVTGMVFETTAEELTAADRYEVAQYSRVEVTLKSGVKAWVYVGT